ncbi:unnamed protein product [Cylicocyclus nassatus]|uniref:Arrestin C-terminal-like domain-containing protein n=1 Tax=Cylicocyclus nassatus TaxID=53992 RepID=A0AA36M3T9_CYLNA|nr:unnamed protein product [Cylicocyclus nassatus]
MPSSLNIVLSQPHGVYHPGCSVSGTAQLNLEEPMMANSLSISIDGSAFTKWSKPQVRTIRLFAKTWRSFLNGFWGWRNGVVEIQQYTEHYATKVVYIKEETVVWTAPHGAEVLNAGSHKFPFAFTLPENCPPSFESSYGYIRYLIKLELDRPWFFNTTDKKLFTVIPVFDLNATPQMIEPITGVKANNLGVALFKHGKVTMEYEIPKSGFAPGEMIVVNLKINNESTKVVTRARVKLMENSRYVAFPTWETETLPPGTFLNGRGDQEELSRKIATGEQKIFIDSYKTGKAQIYLQVPPTVPSFSTCPIIAVDYVLDIKLETNGTLNRNVETTHPITVGTIPVSTPTPDTQPSAPPLDSPAGPTVEPSAPPIEKSGEPQDTPKIYPIYPPLPPPSYEESVNGVDGTSLDAGDMERYVPCYPFYALPSKISKTND